MADTNKQYAYTIYSNPIRLKSVFVLLGFAGLGVYTGVQGGKITMVYPISGIIVGVIGITISNQIQTSYALTGDEIRVAINLMGYSIPGLKNSAEYSEITGVEWDPDVHYSLGYNPLGDLESHHYNLGGGHVRVKLRDRKDITFSARKEDLQTLQEIFGS